MESTGAEVTAGSNFTASNSTGLTLAKIALAGKLMNNASVPKDDRYIVANTDQKWYLLGSTKATNIEYATVKALANGQIDTYLGFTFKWLPSDRFETCTVNTNSGYEAYRCLAYQKQSILLGMNKDITTSVDVVPTKTNSVLAQAEMFIGASRLQGAGVILMPLLKNPTLDFTQA
jgi:hypothetical protein